MYSESLRGEKMIKYILLAAATLASTGCVYQSITELEIQKGVALCASNMGLASIDEVFDGTTTYECKNGTLYWEGDFPDEVGG